MKLIKILVIGPINSEFDKISKTSDYDFELKFSKSEVNETIETINDFNPDVIIIDLNYPSYLEGITTHEKISDLINLPLVILSDNLEHKSIKKSKKANPFGFIDNNFISNNLFPVFIDFVINKHKKDNLIKLDRRNESQTIQELLKEIQSSRHIINDNAHELITLSNKFTEFQEKTKEQIRNKDKFFSIIAHDMKGPLQGLIGYTEILSKESSELTQSEIREIAGDLHSSAKTLLELLEDFLHWSRIQRGAIDSEPSLQNLNQIVKLNFDLLSLQASQKNISLINNIFQEQMIFADLNMVNTIIRNLVSNAIKFTNPGGKIEISSKKISQDYIEIVVEDNGIGIKENDLLKLFRIDSQHTTLGTANEKGTGLGLTLCKELAEKNHGHINVESKFGSGTKFILTLAENIDAFNLYKRC